MSDIDKTRAEALEELERIAFTLEAFYRAYTPEQLQGRSFAGICYREDDNTYVPLWDKNAERPLTDFVSSAARATESFLQLLVKKSNIELAIEEPERFQTALAKMENHVLTNEEAYEWAWKKTIEVLESARSAMPLSLPTGIESVKYQAAFATIIDALRASTKQS